jgi:UDP-N-acetylglucosamine 3-dehydrogenase
MGKNHMRVLNELSVLHSVVDPIAQPDITVPQFNTVEDLLLNPLPDAVVIATPTQLHYEVGLKCLRAGCHVLMEKPAASTLEQAWHLWDEANQYNLIYTVGYIERYNPAVECFLKYKNLVGDITSVHTKRVGGIPRSAQNVVLDLMTHDIDIVLSLLEKNPKKVYSHLLTHNSIVDSAQVLMDFENAAVTLESNWISPRKIRTISITGTEGIADIDLIGKRVHLDQGSNRIFSWDFQDEPLRKELTAFIKSVETNQYQPFQVTGAEAANTLNVTLQAAGLK